MTKSSKLVWLTINSYQKYYRLKIGKYTFFNHTSKCDSTLGKMVMVIFFKNADVVICVFLCVYFEFFCVPESPC